jgi:hypothetical protein
MAGFRNPIRLEETDQCNGGRTVYRLLEPVEFCVGAEPSCLLIRVPEGYRFDGASVPRILWGVFEPLGRHAKPACVHDWLYAGGVSRWMADAIFREALSVVGEPFWKAWLAWLAVRLFGRSHYRTLQKREKRQWPRKQNAN